jgi:hypothetical protein
MGKARPALVGSGGRRGEREGPRTRACTARTARSRLPWREGGAPGEEGAAGRQGGAAEIGREERRGCGDGGAVGFGEGRSALLYRSWGGFGSLDLKTKVPCSSTWELLAGGACRGCGG